MGWPRASSTMVAQGTGRSESRLCFGAALAEMSYQRGQGRFVNRTRRAWTPGSTDTAGADMETRTGGAGSGAAGGASVVGVADSAAAGGAREGTEPGAWRNGAEAREARGLRDPRRRADERASAGDVSSLTRTPAAPTTRSRKAASDDSKLDNALLKSKYAESTSYPNSLAHSRNSQA